MDNKNGFKKCRKNNTGNVHFVYCICSPSFPGLLFIPPPPSFIIILHQYSMGLRIKLNSRFSRRECGRSFILIFCLAITGNRVVPRSTAWSTVALMWPLSHHHQGRAKATPPRGNCRDERSAWYFLINKSFKKKKKNSFRAFKTCSSYITPWINLCIIN